jgi:hypothetical protein
MKADARLRGGERMVRPDEEKRFMMLPIESKFRKVQQELGKSKALQILKKNKKASVTVIRAGARPVDHFTAGHVALHSAARLRTTGIKIPPAGKKCKRIIVFAIDNG